MSVPPTAPAAPVAPADGPCAACGAPLAHDQRYCLQCGELRHGARRTLPAVLRGSIHGGRESGIVAASPLRDGGERWPSLAAALAGIACLLLAMGVGVLIGRGGGGNAATPAPITIAGSPAAAAATPAAAFTSDWPAGKDGWTIALSVLAKASTQRGAVAAAKTAATGKGATAVGALDTDAYPSLTAGSYLVYSGVYDAEQAATTALAALKANFADARVVRVTATAAASSASSSKPSSGGTSKSTSSSATTKGSAAADDTKKAFEETKKTPKTVGTGGKPPPTDNKPAGGGSDVQEIG